jgi:hypothetical protein
MKTVKVNIGGHTFMLSLDKSIGAYVFSSGQLKRFRRTFIDRAPYYRRGELETCLDILERNPSPHELRCIGAFVAS